MKVNLFSPIQTKRDRRKHYGFTSKIKTVGNGHETVIKQE